MVGESENGGDATHSSAVHFRRTNKRSDLDALKPDAPVATSLAAISNTGPEVYSKSARSIGDFI